jgi:hypothetical protein
VAAAAAPSTTTITTTTSSSSSSSSQQGVILSPLLHGYMQPCTFSDDGKQGLGMTSGGIISGVHPCFWQQRGRRQQTWQRGMARGPCKPT